MNSSVSVPALSSLVADPNNRTDDFILHHDYTPPHSFHSLDHNRMTVGRRIPETDNTDLEIQNESSLISNCHVTGFTVAEVIRKSATLDHNGDQVISTEVNVHQKNAQQYGSDVQASVEHGFAEAHGQRSPCNSISEYKHSVRKESLIESTECKLVSHERSFSRKLFSSEQQVQDVTAADEVIDGVQADEAIIQTNLVDEVTNSECQEIKDNMTTLPQATVHPWMLIKHRDIEVKEMEHVVNCDAETKGTHAISIKVAKEKNFKRTPEQDQDQGESYIQVRNSDFAEKKRLTGRTIRKRFGKKYFLGIVDSYDSEYNWYKIHYEDGDEEDLEETEVQEFLLPDDYLSGVSTERRRLLEQSFNERKSKKCKHEGLTNEADKTSKKDLRSTQSIGCSGGEGSSSESLKARMNLGHERQVIGGKEETWDSKRPWTGIRRYLKKQETTGKSLIKKGLNQEIIGKEERALKRGAHKFGFKENSRSMCNNEGTTEALLGTLVCKRFSGRSYNGRVVKYDKETKYYMVEYEDGDSEELELCELKPILIFSLAPTTEKCNGMADVQVGTDLIGTLVRKKLGRTYNIGNVVGFNVHSKMYKIKYEDGHEEDLTWCELEQILVEKLECPMEQTANDFANDDADHCTKMDANVTQYHHKEEKLAIDNNNTMVRTGESLIGRCTLKKSGRKVYAGNVISYDKKKKLYKVKYKDGDQEELEWSELEPTLLQQQQRNSADVYGEYVFNESDSGRKSKKKRSAQIESRDLNESEAIRQKSELGSCLIGSSTRKKFGRKFYAGNVIDYDKKNGFYRVRYEDGDEEDLEWSELESTLVKHLKVNIDEDKEGPALIGRSVRKKFSGKLYNGKIISFNNKTKFFKVKYEDEEEEELEWDELQHVLTANSEGSTILNN